MATVYAIHAPDADKLAEVVSEMRTLGAPTIRVVDCGDYLQALEGSHRLAAAAQLGLTPNFEVYGQDDLIAASTLDWSDNLNVDESYPAGELAGEAFSPYRSIPYTFA